MWVRNGLQIKGQAMTYIQCNFCNSMVDADLYLLQICATQIPSDIFLTSVVDKFHITEWMNLARYMVKCGTFLDGEHDTPMLESCLTFLATLMNTRTNLGVNDASLSQLEIVTLLCMADRTHSQLMELMPERCGAGQSRDFELVLSKVADFKAPVLEVSGQMLQGMYAPKPVVWEELYDPIHILLRAVHRRDFQTSLDRFTEYVQQAGKFKGNGAPWPPFRIPGPCHPAYEDPRKLLQSRVFHAMMFVVLYKAVHGQNVTEHVIALAIYLLEMAVESAEPFDQLSQVCQASRPEPNEITDRNLNSWYKSDWLSSNLRTVVTGIRVVPEPAVVYDSSDSEIEWETSEVEGEISELPASSSTVGGTSSVLMLEGTSVPALSMDSSYGENSLALTVPQRDVVVVSSPDSPRENEAALPSIQRHLAVLAGTEMVPASPASSTSSGSSAGPSVSQPALPNVPQHLAVLAGTEIVPATSTSLSDASTTDLSVVPGYHYMPNVVPVTVHGSHNQIALAPHNSSEVVPSSSGSRKGLLKHRRHVTPGPSGSPETVEVNESIISLLLKLHSLLSGTPDSYNPDESSSNSSAHQSPDSRIGDGPHFIGMLLRRISALDPLCKDDVQQTRCRLWPQAKVYDEEDQRQKDAKEKERKQRAKERQQKVMEQFASQQKIFLDNIQEKDDEDLAGMDCTEEQRPTLSASMPKYQCVICGQLTHSTAAEPMGVVVLLQSTSVLGHKRRLTDRPVLPTSEEERQNLWRDDTLASHFDRRIEELSRQFDALWWQLTVNLGWEGGIYVQTCGHHLHLQCLSSYLNSLRSQQRQQNLSVERGEYLCPVCRQLSNSVLPLSPQLGECSAVVRSQPANLDSLAMEIINLLNEIKCAPDDSSLGEALGKAMEDMTNSTYHKFKQRSRAPTSQSVFLFVTSIARTNLEVELVQKGNSLVTCASSCGFASGSASWAESGSSSATASESGLGTASDSRSGADTILIDNIPVPLTSKRTCIVPLLHVLAVHSRMLLSWPIWHTFKQLAGVWLEPREPLALTLYERGVPLLLQDPTALLIHFVLLLPLHIDQSIFSCIVKVLYNLLYFQVAMQLSCHMTDPERAKWRASQFGQLSSHEDMMSLDSVMALIIGLLEQTHFYQLEDQNCSVREAGTSMIVSQAERERVELKIQELCLPFLRIAALLRHHLYNQNLPDITSPESEFVGLVYFLELVTEGMDLNRFNAAVALNWPANGSETGQSWCGELVVFVNLSQISAHNILIDHHITWHRPRLLRLPHLYDTIFQYYHRKQCNQCHSVPREISICLLCGTVVCLKESCCKQSNVCEAVQHSIDCGGGTGIFLVVTSSCIIVIRDKRACLWGCVYLDSFGEEDRDLKRGKPLYLSRSRYWLLEQQWLSIRFDHTVRKWIWHRDGL